MADIVFNCVHCEAPFTVTEDHLGAEVSCPECDGGNVLPTAEEYYGADTVLGMQPIEEDEPDPHPHGQQTQQNAGGLPDFFSDAEWTELATSDRVVYNAVYDWSAKPSWRFALMAAMMRNRLTNLRAVVNEPLEFTRTISFFRSRGKANDAMLKHANRFIYLSSNLNQQLGTYLWYSLFQHGLQPQYDFFDRITPWIEHLAAFHADLEDLPLMDDDDAAAMQDSMARWVPWVWQSLDRLADRLDYDSDFEHQHDSRIRAQVSVLPPSMHAFFIAQAKFYS